MTDKTRHIMKGLKQPAGIVLGTGSVTALSIIRSLGRQDIPVIGIDGKRFTMGAVSRYCSSTEVFDSEDRLLSLLSEIGGASCFKNVIFCESDAMVLFVDKHRQLLEKNYRLCLPSGLAMKDIINKKSMTELSRKSGLPTPLTFSYPEASFEEIRGEITSCPIIIKPSYSQPEHNVKGIVVYDETELRMALDSGRFTEGAIIQEIISGSETNLWTCMGYCNANSDILALVTGHKLRQRPRDFGIATLAVSQENERIRTLTGLFLKKIGYAGCFELEFKKDESRDDFFFIEINPRICSLNEMAKGSGTDLVFIAYCDMCGMPLPGGAKQRDNVFWIHISKDFDSCVKYYSRDNKAVLLDWIRRASASDAYAVFDLHDPGPFIYDIASYFYKFVRGGRRRSVRH